MLALPALWAVGRGGALAAVTRLDYRGRYLFLPIGVNGRPMTALLDSGAQLSVIDRGVATALRLQMGGRVVLHGPAVSGGQATLARGVAIDVAGITLRPAMIVVTDLSTVAGQFAHGPVDMILGRDLFDAAVVAIDIGRGTLAIRPPNAPRPGVRLPLTKQFGVETIPILIDGKKAQATFDLGNSGRMTISGGFARRNGLLAAGRSFGAERVQTMNGPASRLIVPLRSVEIAGRRVAVPNAAVNTSDVASDALIGIDMLRHFRMICDFAHRAVWLDPV
jgi:predicted aspartyl protease